MAARGRKARLASTFGPASAHSWFVAPGRSVACGSAQPGTANKFAGPISGGEVSGTEWQFEDALA